MGLKNMVVIKHRDGNLTKGVTLDFNPTKETFHVAPPGSDQQVLKISASDLKAVFYVKTLEGNGGGHASISEVTKASTAERGLKIKVTFTDGEILIGTTNGYSPNRPGFFVIPVEKDSNNERVYVYKEATESVETWT